MIQEITDFVDSIPVDYHTDGLPLSQGLHIMLSINATGDWEDAEYSSFFVTKKGMFCDLDEKGDLKEIAYEGDFALREFYSKSITLNKSFDTKYKKILSSSPYVVSFKTENISKISDSLEGYFQSGITYLQEDAIPQVTGFKKFCKIRLRGTIESDPKYKYCDKQMYIRVYLNVPLEKVRACNELYLAEKLFISDTFSIKYEDDIWGASSFLNGANAKKPFMLHQTVLCENGINMRISKKSKVPAKLYSFEQLLCNRKLPSPVPIFIHKKELMSDFIKLIKREPAQGGSSAVSFRSVMRQLFEEHRDDVSDYYLINWSRRKCITINDIDYVSQFKYDMKDCTIVNVTQIPNIPERISIENVFDFEMNVVQKIFNNTLIVKTKKDSVLFKYFDDIDAKYTTHINYQNIFKYRKAFYDFIYKSKHESINGTMFYDLLVSNILDDIKRDEYKDRHHTRDFAIKEKLNILFSLNNYFDKQKRNFGGLDMGTKIPEYQENMRKLLHDNEYHIANDQEFAFAAGQLIYYILTRNQASNKSHALLEPFISKNEPSLFKQVIVRGIEQYKHAFSFGSPRFEKLAAEVLGYECSIKIKDLLPVLLAGYFCPAIIFEKTKN